MINSANTCYLQSLYPISDHYIWNRLARIGVAVLFICFSSTTFADNTDHLIAGDTPIQSDLMLLQKAGKAGLSQILKTFCADGGKFTLQNDGGIRITPGNPSLLTKLLERSHGIKKTKDGYDKKKKPSSINNSSQDQINAGLINRLKEANEQGLATLLSQLSSAGGQFELQDDGAIKIIPNDKTLSRKLLLQSAGISAQTELTSQPYPDNASIPPNDSSTTGQENSANSFLDADGSSQNENASSLIPTLTENEIALFKRLQEANSKGLSTLLNKLDIDGGSFERVEDRGIRIIPKNRKKAKALLNDTLNLPIKAKKELTDNHSNDPNDNEAELTQQTIISSIRPPINTWVKAKKLAIEWISQAKKEKEVSVGKIRKFKWIYLISFLNNNTGAIDTQLIIHIADGKVAIVSSDEFHLFNLSTN